MSTRMVKDEFWTDSYVEELTLEEKFLFLYLLTNPLCNVAGAYEIRIKRITFETGIPPDEVERIFKKFDEDNKVVKIESWVFILNFTKHQARNPNIEKGIERVLAQIPENIRTNKAFERVYKVLASGLGNSTLLNLTKPYSTQPNAPRDSVPNSSVKNIFQKFKKLSPSLDESDEGEQDACHKLIAQYGEETERIVDLTISIQGKKYAPKVLTPSKMWEKMGDVVVFLRRNNQQVNSRKA